MHTPSVTARRLRPLALATTRLATLALAPAAVAQDGKPIEQQMTPEQFRAAGLDQLSAEQLANLNAWLNRTIDTEAGKAAASAKKQVEDENRGFFNFGSSEPVVGRIVGEFRGFSRGREYTLDNGQVWRQFDSADLPGVNLDNPVVTISPGLFGAWYLKVEGYNTRAKVERVE